MVKIKEPPLLLKAIQVIVIPEKLLILDLN